LPVRTSNVAFCVFGIAFLMLAACGCNRAPATSTTKTVSKQHSGAMDSLRFDGETHLANIVQLSFGGENAEAYFSFDNTRLIFQSTRDSFQCDQIFSMNIDGSNVRLLSSGTGRTTCAYFFPNEQKILYSSTFRSGDACPPKPDYSMGYVWPIYQSYDIYKADLDGGNVVPLTDTPGYDAEATIAPDGSKIVFTSTRDGDLDLYVMNTDGSDVTRLTDDIGYDGGAFFSPDSKSIVYRAGHPKTDDEIAEYKELLAKGLIRPNILEIFTMNADGTGKKQLTSFNAACFCPFYTPDGKKIIFSSNLAEPDGHNFDLYLIGLDGSNLERLTYCPSFDGFPMFSFDGKKLVFCSNRHNKEPHETNVFIADWVP
jgi:TolB protein